MSGTPVSSVVDDLLGQLIVLGVEPYCSRGDNGDAFWEREVRGRWNAKQPEGLEVVHEGGSRSGARSWCPMWCTKVVPEIVPEGGARNGARDGARERCPK